MECEIHGNRKEICYSPFSLTRSDSHCSADSHEMHSNEMENSFCSVGETLRANCLTWSVKLFSFGSAGYFAYITTSLQGAVFAVRIPCVCGLLFIDFENEKNCQEKEN